ncbi:MAG: hypothetical protein H6Q58_1441 [Firmicutes bacterium]|nr:hypothetical protein [Bacillota bacterium]
MKTKMSKSSIVFFIAAAFVAVVGTSLLINNILLYSDNVTMYVSQGYSVETVNAQLLPAQLIPGVLEPIGVMYGIAFVLAAAGVLNNKLSKVLELSAVPAASALPEAEAEVEEVTEAVEAEEEAAVENETEAEAAVETIVEEAEKKEDEVPAV